MKNRIGILTIAVASFVTATAGDGFTWKSEIPEDCPFERSPTLTGVHFTGPWRIVSYMKDFGEQAYFLNFPSKFISEDGCRLWLCYSANFSSGWNGVDLNFNPPGGRYGLSLHEVMLMGPDGKRKLQKRFE